MFRIAVIGVGALGRHHARILSQMEGVQLVAVADANAAQAQAVAESCGCESTADYRTLLDRVDAASIVVPTFLHRKVASDFLKEGLPILVEKPLAGCVADGEVLVEMAAVRKTPLQVGHIERFNPAFQQAAELAGDVKYIRAERLSPYAFRSMDIGAVHDLMIHDIELAIALARSNVLKVEAFGLCAVGGHEDCVQARLNFENGCIADLTANRVCPEARRTLQTWSDRGCVLADLHQRTVTHFAPGAALLAGALPYELAQAPGADIAALKTEVFGKFIEKSEMTCSTADALTAELASFVAAAKSGTTPVVDGVQGLKALAVADRVVSSVRCHSWDGVRGGRIGPHAHMQAKRKAA